MDEFDVYGLNLDELKELKKTVIYCAALLELEELELQKPAGVIQLIIHLVRLRKLKKIVSENIDVEKPKGVLQSIVYMESRYPKCKELGLRGKARLDNYENLSAIDASQNTAEIYYFDELKDASLNNSSISTEPKNK